MPPSNQKVNVVRQDGTVLSVTPEQANRLKLLGYRDEEASEANERAQEQALEEYYSTGEQQFVTGVESVGRGLSLGATDYLLGDEDTSARARYNPGTAIAFEALGALAPLVLSGGATAPEQAAGFGVRAAARLAPTSLISRGATSAAAGLGIESKLAKSAVAGVIEGGLYGGAQAANHTYLTGDPITAETILHGAKWGALYGGGLGMVGHGITVAGEHAAATIAAKKTAAEAVDAKIAAEAAATAEAMDAPITRSVRVGKEAFEAVSSEVRGFSSKLKEATETADALISGTADKLIKLGETSTVGRGAIGAVGEAIPPSTVAIGETFPAGYGAKVAQRLGEEAPFVPGAMPVAQGARTSAQKATARYAQNDAFSQGTLTSAQKAARRAAKLDETAQGGAVSGGVGTPFSQRTKEATLANKPGVEVSGPVALPPVTTGELATIRRKIQQADRAARKAVEAGEPLAAERAIAKYEAAVKSASERLGVTTSLGDPGKAFRELTEIKAVSKAFDKFPRSIEEFASMTAARAGETFETLERAQKLAIYPEMAKAVDDAANRLSEALGIQSNGLAGLRNAYASSKELLAAEKAAKKLALKTQAKAAKEAAKPPKEEVPEKAGVGAVGSLGLYHMGKVVTGSALGGSAFALGARKLLSGETLAAMRNAAVERIRVAAAKYAPGAGKAIKRIGPRIEPLAVKLDGTYDNSNKKREDLAAARAKEFWDAASTINDRLYKGVEAVGITQPELGPAVHSAGVAAFKAMLESVPRDPGVISGLKSIWKPSFLQAELLSRRLEVFHDPIGQAEEMLASGNFDPIKVKTLSQVSPAVYQELRMGVLDRIAEPGVMDSMSYNDQIGIGTMLDIPIHSSMRPEHIAASQQLFLVRNKPLPMPVQSTQGSNGGRPSAADNDIATKSQKITDR